MEPTVKGPPLILKRRRIKGSSAPFHLYGELHSSILENIFSRLPSHKVGQLRSMSRSWNRRLSSVDFMSLLRANTPEKAWFVVNHKSAQGVDVLAAYSHSAKAWFKLPLAFLGRLGSRHVAHSSIGGVVAFLKQKRSSTCEDGPNAIFVIDPRKASLISKVACINPQSIIDTIAMVPVGGCAFKLIVIGDLTMKGDQLLDLQFPPWVKLPVMWNSEGRALWVFDSQTSSFRRVHGFGWSSSVQGVASCSLVIGSKVYFLGKRYGCLRIMAYDVNSEELELQGNWVPGDHEGGSDLYIVVDPNLFCCRGKFVTVGIVRGEDKDEFLEEDEEADEEQEEDVELDEVEEKEEDEDEDYEEKEEFSDEDSHVWDSWHLKIWERDIEGGVDAKWHEIARMPKKMWEDVFWNSACEHFTWLRVCGSENLVFMQLENVKAMVCNLDNGSWEYLPNKPKKIGQKTCEACFMLDLL